MLALQQAQNQLPRITIDSGLADATLYSGGLNIMGGEWRGNYQTSGTVNFRNGLDRLTTVDGALRRTPIPGNSFTFPRGGQSFSVINVGTAPDDRSYSMIYNGPVQPNGSYQRYIINFQQGQRAELTESTITPNPKGSK